jgi:[ribosomal protein S18]-alanine N-acetyltransferase
MTGELRIRAMSPADLPAVVALALSLPTAPHWRQSTYEFALNPASIPERIALIAEGVDGAVAGFAIASITGSESELETIAVASQFQRQGVARGLFERLATLLGERGVQTVFLEVRASNAAALELYRALGFAESGRRRGYYADPIEDALVFRIQLSL